jgi:hypothetical protein
MGVSIWHILAALIFASLFGLIPAFVARRRGYSFGLFWLLGLLFFPVALVGAIIAPRRPSTP